LLEQSKATKIIKVVSQSFLQSVERLLMNEKHTIRVNPISPSPVRQLEGISTENPADVGGLCRQEPWCLSPRDLLARGQIWDAGIETWNRNMGFKVKIAVISTPLPLSRGNAIEPRRPAPRVVGIARVVA
jgi:hypothetical protein